MKKSIVFLTTCLLLAACSQRQKTAMPEHYYLQQGDSVAVISPSSLPDSAQLQATMDGLAEWGYVPVAGRYAAPEMRSLDDCISDLMWALRDPSVKAIFCIRGGYAATEVMDALPLDSIKRYPKLIIGYSDITVYHSAWTTAGLPSIHASMSAAFGSLPEECKEAERKMLTGEMPHYRFESQPYHHNGEAEGILIGGNLSTFAACMQTAYDCTQTCGPFILLLEDVEESYQASHRYMTILKHLGVLDRMQGIILGDWADFEDGTCYLGDSRGGEWNSIYEMLERRVFRDMEIPIATDMPFGHGKLNYPLRMGAPIRLTVTDEETEIAFL